MGFLSSGVPEEYQGTPQWRAIVFVLIGAGLALIGVVQMIRGDLGAWVLAAIGAGAILVGVSLLRRQVWGIWLLAAMLLAVIALSVYGLATSDGTRTVRIGRQLILPAAGLVFCIRMLYSHYRGDEA